MLKRVCDKKNLTSNNIAKKIQTTKNQFQIHFYFLIFHYVLIIKKRHKIYNILLFFNSYEDLKSLKIV